MLQVIDEASGVDDMVIDALDGNLSGGGIGKRLVMGNPLIPNGWYYETLFDPTYYKVKISIFDTPLFTGEINEIPLKYRKKLERVLPNENFVRDAEIKYGKDSPFWKAKILGEFPEDSSTGMFNIKDIEYAYNNDEIPEGSDVYITCDVARYGGDSSVITVWKGLRMVEMIEVVNNSLMEVVGRIVNVDKTYKANYIIIDSTGLGAGVVDRLNELEYDNIYAINFSESAFESDKYANIMTEMFFHLKNMLESHKLKLIKNDYLTQELMAMEYTFDSRGRFKLVDSHKLKRGKLGRSPDRAVATALRFAVVNRPKVIYTV